MRRLTALSLALALTLTLAACGDDESEPATGATGSAGSTGAQGVASTDIATAGEFMDASIPDQGQAVQELAQADPACEGVDTKLGGDFQVAVAIDAASASSETSLAEIINGQCSES